MNYLVELLLLKFHFNVFFFFIKISLNIIDYIIIEEEAPTPFFFRPGLAWADVESPTIYMG